MRSPETHDDDVPRARLPAVAENWRSLAGHYETLLVQAIGLSKLTCRRPKQATLRSRIDRLRIPALDAPNEWLADVQALQPRIEAFKANWATRHQAMHQLHQEPSTAQ